MEWREKRKAKKALKERGEREADARAAAAAAPPIEPPATASEEFSAPTANGGPVATASAPELAAEAETEIEMCQKLQEALGRPVILVKERRRDRAWHTAIKHQRVAYGLGMLGLVIATPLTHGTAPLILTAFSSSIPLLDFGTFFDKKKVSYNQGVILDQAAIDALLEISARKRAGIAQAAINAKGSVDGRVTLTGADIEEAGRRAVAAEAAAEAAAAAIPPVESPAPASVELSAPTGNGGPGPVQIGVRMGLAVIGSGLLLLALTIIPEDIHTLMTRVASLILVVGVLIIGGALANGSWLKGPASPPPSLPWPAAPPDPALRVDRDDARGVAG
jgi:hypothetical protein